MATLLGARRRRRPPGGRERPRRLPRGARLPVGAGGLNARVERLRQALADPLLVTDVVNVRYLTGFVSTNAALLVEDARLRLFSDFRYAERARQVEGVEFEQLPRDLVAGLAEALAGRVAFEADSLTYARYEALRAGGLELVPTRGLVEQLRAVKDEDEIAAIRRATEVTNRAFARLAGERFSGRTERELAWRMEQLLHEEGGHALSFPVVVAAGANGASPHAEPGERPVERGQAVIVDAGAVVDGYCSDCTRTFAVGALDGRLADAYDVCLDAQLAALEAIRPGLAARDADAIPRRMIDETEFAGTFGHGLGHGVGLQVHEAPGVRPESDDVLTAGHVTSVEPGIYLSGEGGIRIEDLVIVHEGGPEILTSFSKELVAVA